MKITTRLAASQLTIHRTRTVWSLVAIALATALTVAVASFVASGNALLVGFLGDDYGVYGLAYQSLLLIPALLFGAIIVCMSVIVISNVFRVSADDRIAEFGILKCVGATEKQITSTMLSESVLLCAAGIPAGIVLGLLLAFGGIQLANYFLADLNSLTSVMIREFQLSLPFVLSWQALLASAAVSFLTVLFSAWLPARKAAKVSAVDSVRGTGSVQVNKTRRRTYPLVQKYFGFEGALAAKSIHRNRRNFRATVVALSMGVVLFLCLGSLSAQAAGLQELLKPQSEETVVVDYVSDYDRSINPATGREEVYYRRPIDSAAAEQITQKLGEFDDTQIFGSGLELTLYDTVLPAQALNPAMAQALSQTPQEHYTLAVELLPLDAKNYEALCKTAGVPVGSNLLLNHYSYNDDGTLVHLAPFLPSLREISLRKADGSTTTVPVHGMLPQSEIPLQLFYPNTNPVRLVVPQAQVRGYSWFASPADIPGFIAYANEVLAQAFPEAETGDYMEAGFSTRAYKTDDYMKVMNIAIALVSVFLYSFVALLLLIGFTTVISTMSTNVLLRAREFAVLQSVGMTPEGLRRMLTFESVFCSLKALLLGLPIGLLLTVCINAPIRKLFPIPYAPPLAAIALSAAAVFAITLITTGCAGRKLQRQNIIATIRTQSGR